MLALETDNRLNKYLKTKSGVSFQLKSTRFHLKNKWELTAVLSRSVEENVSGFDQ